ncbi:hypothetical protein Tco_0492938 [Tanacetum coccineum]
MLMKDAISIIGRSANIFRISSDMMRQLPPEPSRQEAFEELVMNFIHDQEEKVKQLEEYIFRTIGIHGSIYFRERLGRKVKVIPPLHLLDDPPCDFDPPQSGRKAHLLGDKQIPSIGVYDEVFSIWKEFGGNTRDLGSFGEETDKTTDLHQNLLKIMLTERGDGVTSIKRRRHDL